MGDRPGSWTIWNECDRSCSLASSYVLAVVVCRAIAAYPQCARGLSLAGGCHAIEDEPTFLHLVPSRAAAKAAARDVARKIRQNKHYSCR
jgi:hypothetical protein